MKPNFFRSALIAGLIVGTLDISAAFLHFYIKTGKNPLVILKYIASGVFGKDAYTNDGMMLWGLLFHFIIAISFSIFFFLLARQWPLILKYKLITAIIYGIFMWSVTQFIIIPLSRIKPAPVQLNNALIAIGILVICISLPLTFLVQKFIRK